MCQRQLDWSEAPSFRFLIKELAPGFLDGVSGTYKDPEGYFVCEKDPEGFARFEATFPPMEKLKLPGQLF